jgi:hypothetical protein
MIAFPFLRNAGAFLHVVRSALGATPRILYVLFLIYLARKGWQTLTDK